VTRRHLRELVTHDDADFRLLSLANEKRKFGLSLGPIPDDDLHLAFERGIDARWFDLVDISPIAAFGPHHWFRMFRLTDAGVQRLADLAKERQAS